MKPRSDDEEERSVSLGPGCVAQLTDAPARVTKKNPVGFIWPKPKVSSGRARKKK